MEEDGGTGVTATYQV